ncbi:MAG: sialate O-acetylesterase [Planctomycetaceae bacterium]
MSVRVALCMLAMISLGKPYESVQADDADLRIISPQPWQVIQRIGFDPALREMEPENSAALGFAEVVVSLELTASPAESEYLEYRLSSSQVEKPENGAWKQLAVANSAAPGNSVGTSILVPAGGWYRLEIRRTSKDGTTHQPDVVERFGVGEVFLVAGQSYATNTNDEKQNVTEPAQRVVAFNTATGSWNVANDPQPAPDGSDGGSIWPLLGDALVKDLGVPVAFVNVAVGATSSTRWLPDGDLHKRLCEAGKRIGRFRAVLWQQGNQTLLKRQRQNSMSQISGGSEPELPKPGDLNRCGSPRSQLIIRRSTMIPKVRR